MVATPMRLEDALRFAGYTIDVAEVDAFQITVPTGVINVPAMLLSSLTWQREGDPAPMDSLYLNNLPLFAPEYGPIILSHILDRYRTRRIGYDTPDSFALGIRRWANLNLGPQSILNLRYLSTAVPLPLTTQDATNTTNRTTTEEGTTENDVLGRNASSDFPQTTLSGDTDYASAATDYNSKTSGTDSKNNTDNIAQTLEGRQGATVMAILAEQRANYLNVDAELLEALEPLFLGVWDRSEQDLTFPPIPVTGLMGW